MLFEHRHRSDHVRLPPRRECVQLNIGRDRRGDEFGVCCSPCTATANGL